MVDNTQNTEGTKSTNIDKSVTIINNINPKKNPFTSIFGGIFLVIGLVLLIAPAFVEYKTVIPYQTGWWLIGVGGVLFFMPDYLFGIVKKVADKKSEQL